MGPWFRIPQDGTHGLASTGKDNRHAVFLFDDQTIGHVMPTYTAFLLELFSESELRDGTLAAIGSTHPRKENDKVSRYVAMTRPSHLVCLTMREGCLRNTDVALSETVDGASPASMLGFSSGFECRCQPRET